VRTDIKGVIVSNDSKRVYDWIGWDATSPRDIRSAIESCPPGETLDIYINSPGGDIGAASEIYSDIRAYTGSVKIHVTGVAASAASVIMCAAPSEISPTAMVMIHCVSTYAGGGNHTDYEKILSALTTADRAMCQAYVDKTGKTQKELLSMMDKETYMTAQEAVDNGFCDSIAGEAIEMAASMEEKPFDQSIVNRMTNLLDRQKLIEQTERFEQLGGSIND
jgi:ATP-dependent Clp protease protease subunit